MGTSYLQDHLLPKTSAHPTKFYMVNMLPSIKHYYLAGPSDCAFFAVTFLNCPMESIPLENWKASIPLSLLEGK